MMILFDRSNQSRVWFCVASVDVFGVDVLEDLNVLFKHDGAQLR